MTETEVFLETNIIHEKEISWGENLYHQDLFLSIIKLHAGLSMTLQKLPCLLL